MIKKHFYVSLVSILLLSAPAVAVTVVHVPADATLQTALDTVPDGGVVEIAAGTYNSPSDGFTIINPTRSFTVRAAEGATVTLSGGGANRILRQVNLNPPTGDTVVFEGITFADGLSTTNGQAGGVTFDNAYGTFIDCTFTGNNSNASTTGGGALALFGGSRAHIYDSLFQDNLAKNEGAAMRVGINAEAHVHNSRFLNNRTNEPNHRVSAAGGAIHVTNSYLTITNSRFEGNESGCVGGAVYAIANWTEPSPGILQIINSTFVDNKVESDPTVTCTWTEVGGAVHVENFVEATVISSRFEENASPIGGAFSMYRADATIKQSTFRGNRATGTGASAGFGGTFMINSNDTNDASTNNGAINRPSASLAIDRTFIQGRFGGTTTGGNKGACMFVRGDVNRQYGQGGVAQNGGVAENRATLTIDNTVLADCDVLYDGTSGTGAGGAMSVILTDMTMEDSLIIDSDALGSTSNGGAMRLTLEAKADITRTHFVNNTAEARAAAILMSGAELNLDDSGLYENVVTSGAVGSAIWTNQDVAKDLDCLGTIQNTVFSNNSGVDIKERDYDDGPINAMVYNGNSFFPTGENVYNNDLTGTMNATALNTITVVRSAAANTVKSTVDNLNLGSLPALGTLVAAPSKILAQNAAGDPAPPTDAFLGFAWSGSGATLDGLTQNDNTGMTTAGSGVHTLSITGAGDRLATITNAAIPGGTFEATPIAIDGGQSSELSWTTTSGTFFDVFIDRETPITTPAASGGETVTPSATKTYNFLLLTEEGGFNLDATVYVDEDPPSTDTIFEDGFESGGTSSWSNVVGG